MLRQRTFATHLLNCWSIFWLFYYSHPISSGCAAAKFMHRQMVFAHTRSTTPLNFDFDFDFLCFFERVCGGQIHAQAHAFCHTPARFVYNFYTFGYQEFTWKHEVFGVFKFKLLVFMLFWAGVWRTFFMHRLSVFCIPPSQRWYCVYQSRQASTAVFHAQAQGFCAAHPLNSPVNIWFLCNVE